jgi:hypothetical protein
MKLEYVYTKFQKTLPKYSEFKKAEQLVTGLTAYMYTFIHDLK